MVQIQVSCPACGEMQTLDMEVVNTDEDSPIHFFDGLIKEIGIDQYKFGGATKCSCGRQIDSTLIVVSKPTKIKMGMGIQRHLTPWPPDL